VIDIDNSNCFLYCWDTLHTLLIISHCSSIWWSS